MGAHAAAGPSPTSGASRDSVVQRRTTAAQQAVILDVHAQAFSSRSGGAAALPSPHAATSITASASGSKGGTPRLGGVSLSAVNLDAPLSLSPSARRPAQDRSPSSPLVLNLPPQEIVGRRGSSGTDAGLSGMGSEVDDIAPLVFTSESGASDTGSSAVGRGVAAGQRSTHSLAGWCHRRPCVRPMSAASAIRRSIVLCTALWLLITLAYYLSSLAFVVPESEPLAADKAVCSWRFSSARPPATLAVTAASTATSGTAAAAPTQAEVEAATGDISTTGSESIWSSASPTNPPFSTGAHLIAAEIVALWLVAAAANTQRLGRVGTLIVCCALAALSLFWGALVVPDDGPLFRGSHTRAVLEFFMRVSLAACAQALYLLTVELPATSSRSTVAGYAIACFRLGALVTLISSVGSSSSTGDSVEADPSVKAVVEPAHLQWATYALQHRNALFALVGHEHAASPQADAAVAAASRALVVINVVCGAMCVAAAVLAAFVPVETHLHFLRRTRGVAHTPVHAAVQDAATKARNPIDAAVPESSAVPAHLPSVTRDLRSGVTALSRAMRSTFTRTGTGTGTGTGAGRAMDTGVQLTSSRAAPTSAAWAFAERLQLTGFSSNHDRSGAYAAVAMGEGQAPDDAADAVGDAEAWAGMQAQAAAESVDWEDDAQKYEFRGAVAVAAAPLR